MKTLTTLQRCYGGVADGAEFSDSPIPKSFTAAVYFDAQDFELCGCEPSQEKPVRAPYRLDELLSAALAHWVYVPDER